MTVAELIEKLNKIENKNKNIYYTDYQEWFEIDISEQRDNVYIIEKKQKSKKEITVYYQLKMTLLKKIFYFITFRKNKIKEYEETKEIKGTEGIIKIEGIPDKIMFQKEENNDY